MIKLRAASPNEQRTISREHFGFYNAYLIGEVNEFTGPGIDITSSDSFYGGLKRCIETYPILSCVVRDMDTENAYFARVPSIDLGEHVSIAKSTGSAVLASKKDEDSELAEIEALLPSILDEPIDHSRPPWKITVLPLSSSKQQDLEVSRCFIAFSLSHALGDGMSVLAFHRTFIAGIFDSIPMGCSTVPTPHAELPPPFDTAANFPISWGYLLPPLIAVLLPKFITEMLGLRAAASAVTPNTWTASRMFYDPETFHSCVKLIEIPGPDVENALQAARMNGARLTGTIHQAIVRAMSRAIPRNKATDFVSGTAVNMRRAVGKSNNEAGLYVNACYDIHARQDDWESAWTDKQWESARCLTEKLAECAYALRDQPIGLLRYAPSIKKWTAAKMGKERDCSYEVSNVGAFNAPASFSHAADTKSRVTKMIFARPADATSSPLTFTIASVKGGSMVIAIGRQPGALGIPLDAESSFVDNLASFLKEDLKNVK